MPIKDKWARRISILSLFLSLGIPTVTSFRLENIREINERELEAYKDSLNRRFKSFEFDSGIRNEAGRLLGDAKIRLRELWRVGTNPKFSRVDYNNAAKQFTDKVIESGDYMNSHLPVFEKIRPQILAFEKSVREFGANSGRGSIPPELGMRILDSIDDIERHLYDS